jgi:hydroxypyruvate isomerase
MNTHSRYAVNCSMLFTELPLLLRPQAARDAGFEAIEFWWPFVDAVPGDLEVAEFVRAVNNAGVALIALNFAGGDMPNGERGLLSDPAHSSAFRDNVDVAVGIAEQLGTKAFNALYGNRIDHLSPHRQDDLAVENLAHVAHTVAHLGAVVLLEPLSGVPGYPLKTAGDVLAVINRVRHDTGVTSLRLLADLYHLHVNGDDVAAVIDAHIVDIGHVQIADAPGRGAPGTGTMDIAGHLARLEDRGYRGHVSVEYRAAGADPFAWVRDSRRTPDEPGPRGADHGGD